MAVNFTAAHASIPISPSMSGFHKKVKAHLRSERIEAPAVVVPDLSGFAAKLETGLGRIRATVKVGITPDLQGFKTELRSRLSTNGTDLKIPVQLDLTRARSELAAFRMLAGRPIAVNLDIDTGAAVAKLAALQGATKATGAVASAGSSGFRAIGSAASNAASSITGMIRPATAAKVAIGALAAVSLVPLIGQLTQAAGVVALLPAMGAAAAASLAAVVIGSSGVMDAFKKGSAASKAVTDTSNAQAAAARNVTSASRGVESAQRGLESAQKSSMRAQKDLTRARKDAQEQMEDLNLALKGSGIDERSAELAVRRAEKRLRELGQDGQPVTALDFDEAVLNVDSAKQRLEEVRERNVDLREEVEATNKAGIEGSRGVIAAKDAVAAADQGIIDAQSRVTDAQAGLVDAQNAAAEAARGNTAAIDAYNAALENLSPNARAFVESVRGMGDAWRGLRMEVQDSLFEGMGAKIADLGRNYMPILTDGLSRLADVLNGKLRSAMDWLMTDSVKSDISAVLDNTAKALGPLMDGLGNLGRALMDITAVGSEFLPGITNAFKEGTGGFADTIAKMRSDGSLREFMQEAIDTFAQIWRIVVNIGELAKNIFSGSDETGESWLDSIEKATQRWADFFGTPEGQEQIKGFFSDVKEIVDGIVTALQIAASIAGTFGTGGNTTPDNVVPEGEKSNQPGAKPNDSGTVRKIWDAPDDDQGFLGKTSRGFNSIFGYNNETDSYDGGVWQDDRWGGKILGANGWAQQFNPITGMQRLPSLAGDALGGAGNHISTNFTQMKENFDGLKTSISSGWNETIWPALDGFGAEVGELGTGFFMNVKGTATTSWNGLRDGITDGWNNHISPAWNTLQTEGLGGLADKFTEKITNGAVTSWQDLPGAIGSGAWTIINEHFPWLGTSLDWLQTKFGQIVGGIRTIWDGLKSAMADPINWVIDNVINGALKNAWNGVAAVIPGLPTWEGVPRIEVDPLAGRRSDSGGTAVGQQYATGGIIPGYTPGVDTTVVGVGGGEAVMRPEWTRAMGSGYVNDMNRAARTGGVDGVRSAMQHFSNGGIVQSMTSAVQEKFPGMQMTSGLRYTDDGYHSKGMAADFSNGSASTPAMRQLAGWIADNFSNNTIELIHDPFGRNIGGGNPVGDGYGYYGAETMAGHNDHVHWAVGGPVGSGGDPGSSDGGGIMGALGSVISGGVNFARRQAANAFESAASALGSSIPDFGPSLAGQIPKAAFNAIKGEMSAMIAGSTGSLDSGDTPFDIGAGVEQWRDEVIEGLKREGFDPSVRNQNLTLAQIQSESSGNPNAVQQVQDVNSGGNEAVGLLQVIPGTFATHRNPSLPNDRTNPDASISAALRYYRARYGEDLGQQWGEGHGYKLGGIIPGYTPDRDKFNVAVSGGEAIMRPEWTRAVGSDYIDGMNSLARSGGVGGVQQAMGRYALGGIIEDPEKRRLFAQQRFAQWGTELADIGKKAVPQILGFDGTIADPSHRYWQAAEDIQSAVMSQQSYANQMSGQRVDNYMRDKRFDAIPAPMGGGDEFHFHVADVDEAVRKLQTVQKQKQLQFTRR